jgi:hypothetical protein
MEGFRPAALAAAITGFSLGVETGHQLVVIPFVLILWILGRYAGRLLPAITRTATVAVLLAGLWLLSLSLRRPSVPVSKRDDAAKNWARI